MTFRSREIIKSKYREIIKSKYLNKKKLLKSDKQKIEKEMGKLITKNKTNKKYENITVKSVVWDTHPKLKP